MLIIFSCKAHADITMFGDVGLQMLKMMGHSGTVPGAIQASEVATALSQLKAAVAKEQRASELNDSELDDNGDDLIEQSVSINNRALPLIALLTAADKEECHVMWESVGK
ncbi:MULTISPECIES: DUF1840 domain-containing protein [Vibrio]|uniref:DUF1840 domain-containing protein n=1 Tax=Vibrio genomosp. F6 str. FF-238 TaxID=1191298 RepID=A0A1E5DC99_9VIBR|nr:MULTISPECIES: DUF1840 domain-containing protein [Vibrio]NOH82363.1 DUF1840 domain-containing protein [Vibrio sp. 03-59-1]OEE81418.1 hypothetical protein A130_00065 [Vibrio genomosp. F6 str. FF-238]